MAKKIKTGVCYRMADFDRESLNEDTRTAELSFSSESPVERFWGVEILDHSPTSIRLGRLESGGPVLVDHDPSDHVGVVESVSIGADRRGRATVRFGRGARASEIFEDVKDGIRRSVSVGYVIHRMQLEEAKKGQPEKYRATDWEPLEISLVSVPADVSVGVGREGEHAGHEAEIIIREREEPSMSEVTTPAVDLEIARNEARKAEQDRAAALLKVGEQYGMTDLAREYVVAGKSVDQLREAVLDAWKQGAKASPSPIENDLSGKEQRSYSLFRVIRALANPNDAKARQAAAFEFEVSNAMAEKRGKEPTGVFVPHFALGKRDLTTATGDTAKAGYTVSTDLLADQFIELLRNKTAVVAAGARVLTGLQGNVAIPAHATAATAYWVSEGNAPTESTQVFSQKTMSPKTVGTYTEITRKLLLQSSIDVENFVREDLTRVLAIAIDYAAIAGNPDVTATANQPRGIVNTTGTGSVSVGSNGTAPSHDSIVNLWKEVAVDNADLGSLGWLLNAQTAGKLMRTKIDTGSGQFVMAPGSRSLLGFPVFLSQNVRGDRTVGSGSNLSDIIFGNFADLVIGFWSGLDVQVNPYSLDTTGAVRITAFQDCDVLIRHAESFATMEGVITT